MKKTIININNLIGKTANTRESVALFLPGKVKKEERVILNFHSVEFISRSFADELIKKQQEFESVGTPVIYLNANESVLKMLQAVSRTQNKTYRELKKVPVYHYTDRELLRDFLLSV